MATRHPRAPSGVVTISLGVATASPGEESFPERLVADADEALYRAKRAGRNRVEADPGRASRASSTGPLG
jgi:diguanylate cyclase (GGDEF)-like protein